VVQRTSSISALLKRLGAHLVVACALMLAFAPLADSVLCGPVMDPASQASVQTAVETNDQSPVRPPVDSDASCIHGHCHHGAIAIPREGADVASVRMTSASVPQPAGSTGPSAFLSGIERPPRA